MKTLLSAVLTALALSVALPVLADAPARSDDDRRDYDGYYDRRHWHVPRYNFRQVPPPQPGLWIYPGMPRYYHGHDYRRHPYRGPYPGPGFHGPVGPLLPYFPHREDHLKRLGNPHFYDAHDYRDHPHFPRR